MMGVRGNQPIYMRINHMMYRKQIGKFNIEAANIVTDRQELTMPLKWTALIKIF